jgi:hypothetical protein
MLSISKEKAGGITNAADKPQVAAVKIPARRPKYLDIAITAAKDARQIRTDAA